MADGLIPVWAWFAIGLAIVVALYYGPQLLQLGWARRMGRHCRDRKILALTFDDGPGPELQPRLLDLLDSHGVRATFYCLGRRAETHAEAVRTLARRGHEVATHTHDHRHAWKSTPWGHLSDVSQGFATLEIMQDGDRAFPLRFRPAYGKLTLTGLLVAWRRKAPIDWWTIDSGDTNEALPDVSQAARALERLGGGVVLLHDFDREGADAAERAAFVLEVTDQVCRRAKELGLQVVTMSELRAGAQS